MIVKVSLSIIFRDKQLLLATYRSKPQPRSLITARHAKKDILILCSSLDEYVRLIGSINEKDQGILDLTMEKRLIRSKLS